MKPPSLPLGAMAAGDGSQATIQATLDDLRILLAEQREWLEGLEARMERARRRLEALGASTEAPHEKERSFLEAWLKEAEGDRGDALRASDVLARAVEAITTLQAPREKPHAPPAAPTETKGRRPAPEAPRTHRRRPRRRMVYLLPLPILLLLVYGVGYAASGVWPPVFLLDASGSMQHGEVSRLGALDTGDTVLLGATSHVVTYLEGYRTGYTTYGDYGDVVVFQDPLNGTETYYLHRAVARVYWNATADGFDVPELQGFNSTFWLGVDASGRVTDRPFGLRALSIRHGGWTGDRTVTYSFGWTLSEWVQLGYRGPVHVDGFITWGDNVVYTLPTQIDPWIVTPSIILGVARGEVPVVGLLRLSAAPANGGCCEYFGSTNRHGGAPANGWWALATMTALAIAAPLASRRALRLLRTTLEGQGITLRQLLHRFLHGRPPPRSP